MHIPYSVDRNAAMNSTIVNDYKRSASHLVSDLGTSPHLEVATSDRLVDFEWDDFVAATTAGHHVQTSMWSRLKAAHGWTTTRVIARKYGRIVGGAQILVRRCGPGLRIGYIPKGPVCSAGMESATAFVKELQREVRAQKLACLLVHP